jgi:hypothetical protein
MCPPLNSPESRPDHKDAFSLVELLVAVSITTVIIFASVRDLDHTQKAFRGSISQVDVMESGRGGDGVDDSRAPTVERIQRDERGQPFRAA